MPITARMSSWRRSPTNSTNPGPIRNAVQLLHMNGLSELQWARDIIDRQVQQLHGIAEGRWKFMLSVRARTQLLGYQGISELLTELASRIYHSRIERAVPLMALHGMPTTARMNSWRHSPTNSAIHWPPSGTLCNCCI